MNSKVPNRIPFKVLLMYSGRMFLLFLTGALLITSLQDMSMKGLGQRILSLGTLFLVIFGINTVVFHYFDRKRKNISERAWIKTFFVGFIFSFFYFYLHTISIVWLVEHGYFQLPNDKIGLGTIAGWRYCTFLFGASFVIYSFIFLVQYSVMTQYEKSQIQMELLQLEASNADAVNQLLRQQIQPHFLFNALNVLKSLIKRDSKRAENYLLHLSDFLRVSISKNTSGISSIEEELKICNDYMEMQRIRFGAALRYDVNVSDSEMHRKLPFFSLQPLLENAIKHNKLTDTNPLFIRIESSGDYIHVSNNLQEKNGSELPSGNGLNMLQERYRILNEEAPIVKKEGGIFLMSLKILENGHHNH